MRKGIFLPSLLRGLGASYDSQVGSGAESRPKMNLAHFQPQKTLLIKFWWNSDCPTLKFPKLPSLRNVICSQRNSQWMQTPLGRGEQRKMTGRSQETNRNQARLSFLPDVIDATSTSTISDVVNLSHPASFTRESSYCFQRVLAIAILFVRLSVTRADQSKTVQARITKYSPSAAWKTLVSGTVKLFYQFEWVHRKRRR